MTSRLARCALVALAAVLPVACNSSTSTTPLVTATTNPIYNLRPPGTGAVAPLTVSSTDFTSGGTLPATAPQLGCGPSAANVSPQLAWTAGPSGTQSYVVQIFDPDAPTGVGFWHWNLVNVPASTTSLPTGFGTTAPTAPVVEAESDYGTSGYGGPCPPVGDPPHHYYFIVSALNVATLSGVTSTSTGAFVTFSMRGTILGQGQIVGTYGR